MSIAHHFQADSSGLCSLFLSEQFARFSPFVLEFLHAKCISKMRNVVSLANRDLSLSFGKYSIQEAERKPLSLRAGTKRGYPFGKGFTHLTLHGHISTIDTIDHTARRK